MKEWNYENEQWTKLPGYLKHLPLFTRHFDFGSFLIRFAWSVIMKQFIFRFYIRLKVVGDYNQLIRDYPKLIIISNHASHLDAVSIAASIPFKKWLDLYIAAAKDYFFANFLFTFFSKHCLGAIPIDRKDRRNEAMRLITELLTTLESMWLILFPEGTRSKDGRVHDFKRGVALFSERTKTPILLLYLEGNSKLWPKGAIFAKPGKLTIHIGPVLQPASIEVIFQAYKGWIASLNLPETSTAPSQVETT